MSVTAYEAFLRHRRGVMVEPAFVRQLGPAAAMVLSQLVWWFDVAKYSTERRVTRDGAEWIAMPRHAWEQEVGLSSHQVRRAEDALAGRGLIECRRWRVGGVPTMHRRPLPAAIGDLLDADAELLEEDPEVTKRANRKCANGQIGSAQTGKSEVRKRANLPIRESSQRGSRAFFALPGGDGFQRGFDDAEAAG